MSKFPRLPSLINRLIDIKWLEEESSQFTVEPDYKIPDDLDQSILLAPFRGNFKGTCISDGFYSIVTTTLLSLPINSNLLVTEWNLHFDKHLILEILKAEVIPDNIPYDSPIISIESNPSVCNTLRKYKFHKIQKELEENDAHSECSENSMVCISNLRKLIVQENNFPEVDEEQEREIDVVKENTKEAKVPIGFGKDSVKKAQNFAKSRMVVNDSSQDVLSMVEPNTTEQVLKMIKEEKPKTSNISIKCDIGIEVFPSYAIEYLKHKYNVV